mmetsp:Transcript_23990/g.77994  ORF Transcript_23990/g.77994 Transcript_23990/m.77994 type:complete len:292 (-) Transcript_23990:437-1312(-)
MFSRRSRRPSTLHASTVLVTSGALFMRSWKSALTPSKRFESSGSCTRMSAEPTKTDSSIAHFLDTSVHVASTESTVPSFFCQPVTASRNLGLPWTYLPADMFWRLRLSVSSASVMVSSTTRLSTSESGNGWYSRLRLAHVSPIFLSAFSMTSSFWARSTISDTASTQWWSSSSRRFPRLNLSSMVNDLPVARWSWRQWRSRIEGWWRSLTSGSDVRSALTWSSRILYTSKLRTPLLSALISLAIFFVSSMSISTSMLFQSVWFQAEKVYDTEAIMSHICFRSKSSSSQRRR